jgi:hypothetical protein
VEKTFAPVSHVFALLPSRGGFTLAPLWEESFGTKLNCMRFIPTKVHGVLDYTVGGFIAASPWIFRFAKGGAETAVPLAAGKGAVVYSLLTDYEWGIKKLIPMRTHLMLDLASGVFLAASPWLFGFAKKVWLPHLVMGLFEIGAALMTRQEPETGLEEYSVLDS